MADAGWHFEPLQQDRRFAMIAERSLDDRDSVLLQIMRRLSSKKQDLVHDPGPGQTANARFFSVFSNPYWKQFQTDSTRIRPEDHGVCPSRGRWSAVLPVTGRRGTGNGNRDFSRRARGDPVLHQGFVCCALFFHGGNHLICLMRRGDQRIKIPPNPADRNY